MSTHNTVGIDSLLLQLEITRATGATLGILGDPGTGKTQIHRQHGLQWLRKQHAPESNYIYINAANKSAEFCGMSVPLVASGTCDFLVAEWFRRLIDVGPAMIFVDELDKLTARDQSPWLQLLAEKAIDNVRLPGHVHVDFAGNFRSNGNGSQGVTNIVHNRVRQVRFAPEPERVIGYFNAIKAHPWVISFLAQRTDLINPGFVATQERNCSSRQWEGVSKDLYALHDVLRNPTAMQVVQTVATRIPDHIAQEFAIMTEHQSLLVPFEEVMADPRGCKMPDSGDRGVMWLQIHTIVSRAAGMRKAEKHQSAAGPMGRNKCRVAAYRYAERFPPEFLQAVLPAILSPAIDDPDYTPGEQVVPIELHREGGSREVIERMQANRRIVNDEE